jgi:hypothetical protein
MSSQYYSATAYVGTPHRNEVEVTIPLVGPQGPQGPQGPAGSGGGGDVESVNGQTGVVVLAAADVGAASTSHAHGNLTNAGAIGTTGGLPVKTGTSGVLEAGAFGTAAGQFAEGNHTHTLSAITDAGTAASQDANQDLGTSDQVTFQGVTVNGPPVNEFYPGEGVVNCGKLNLDTYAVDLGGGSTGDGFPSIVFGAINGGITLKGPEGDITTSKVINIPNASGTLGLSEPSDSTFRIVGSSDATKKVAFEVDGLSAATTRTLTVPNASGTLALTSSLTDTQIFTANGTWTKPAGAKMVHYLLIGGGGGGGAGRRSLQNNTLGGGGGGAGGGITVGYIDPAFLGSTESITVAAGGTGAADSADNSNGASGTAGGDSSLGSFIKAKGGAAGGGGTFGAGAGGAATTIASLFYGSNASTSAGAAGAASAAAPSNAAASVYLPTGGGGGGARGSSTNGVGSKGGDIGQTNTGITSAPSIAAGTNGPAGIRSQSSWAGTGGGGGSMSSDNAVHTGFPGGNGGLYGGGGGGGSGAVNASGGSTAGGTGGNGIVIITTYF